ncbi:MAG: 30S ribosomal protein S4 [Oligosphaeraceae bacterium]|nr:30S ribosomal protein S4 [Oligosphaeraceae bacterium]
MADAAAKKTSKSGAKHTLCRRIGQCIWGMPNCPTNSRTIKKRDGGEATAEARAYPAGQHGPTKRRNKLSTYGELLLEKQKLRTFYDLTEHQLRFIYRQSKGGEGTTADKLLRNLEMRLVSVVYRSGLAKTIWAAKQIVSHRHVLVDGRIVDRASYRLKPGQVISINAQRSPVICEISKGLDTLVPDYLQKEAEECKVTVAREPLAEEIQTGVEVMKVIEYYAR